MATNFQVADLIEGANNAVVKWGNIKRGDEVLICTDTLVEKTLIDALTAVCKLTGARVTVAVMEPDELPHQEPPASVAAAMTKVNLVVMCTTLIKGHTKATLDAQTAGAKFLSIGASIEAMAAKSAKYPPEVIFAMATMIAEQWIAGREIRVTDPKGTDLRAPASPSRPPGPAWAPTASCPTSF